jgi:uncharacterized protein YjeT (DUF2065 family)
MWQQLLIGLALVLIIEGIMPFLSPGGMRNLMKAMSEMDDNALRMSGFVSMMIGLALLYIVN